jgi:hypothetical protein
MRPALQIAAKIETQLGAHYWSHMLSKFLHFMLRQSMFMLLWVSLLSLSIGNRTMFERMNTLLFKNSLFLEASDFVEAKVAMLFKAVRYAYEKVNEADEEDIL